MAPPRLPQELVDQIIDLLKDDEHALRACSLTCFAWRPRSQKHLHRNLRVSERQHPAVTERYASHELAAHVQHIEIRCKPPHPWHRMFQPLDPQPSRWLKEERIYRTLDLFPHVTSYRFSYTHFSLPVIHHITAFFSSRSILLTSLEIYEASFEDLNGFATLLAAFPHLLSLKVDRCSWPRDHTFSFETSKLFDSDLCRIPGPKLRTLRVMVHSQVRTDITKWCFAAGIASDFLEWRWEGHAHKAIFDPAVHPTGALVKPVCAVCFASCCML